MNSGPWLLLWFWLWLLFFPHKNPLLIMTRDLSHSLFYLMGYNTQVLPALDAVVSLILRSLRLDAQSSHETTTLLFPVQMFEEVWFLAYWCHRRPLARARRLPLARTHAIVRRSGATQPFDLSSRHQKSWTPRNSYSRDQCSLMAKIFDLERHQKSVCRNLLIIPEAWALRMGRLCRATFCILQT